MAGSSHGLPETFRLDVADGISEGRLLVRDPEERVLSGQDQEPPYGEAFGVRDSVMEPASQMLCGGTVPEGAETTNPSREPELRTSSDRASMASALEDPAEPQAVEPEVRTAEPRAVWTGAWRWCCSN